MLHRDELMSWLARGEREIFTVVVDVTPELAGRLLERNSGNRVLRKFGPIRSVAAYADAMRRGEWRLNGEAIVVSSSGELNDGQHRVAAIIMAGIAVRMQITFGVARDTRHTLDQGVARTPGHILSMYGEKNATHLATAAHFLWAYDGSQNFAYRPSPLQLLETIERNPDLREAVNEVRVLARSFRLSFGYLAGSHVLCRRVDDEYAYKFLSSATDGLNLENGSPVVLLRNRLQLHAASPTRRGQFSAVEQAALYIKAFNAGWTGRRRSVIRWNAGEAFPIAGE